MNFFAFLSEFARNPRAMGSVVPSSLALSREIRHRVDRLCPSNTSILEVGAGTGAITAELVALGRLLIAIEPNPRLGEKFRRRFPGVRLLPYALEEAIPLLRQPDVPIGVIVSSLPLQAFTRERRAQARGLLEHLLREHPGSTLIQYTYRAGDPLESEDPRVLARQEKVVVRNFPPARIWSYRWQG